MREGIITIGIIVYLFFISTGATAIEAAPRITDREIIEALTELKAGQKAIQQQITDLKDSTNKQIADLKDSTNKQIADLKDSTNKQIDSTNKQIAELKEGQKRVEERIDNLIYAVFGIFIALVGIIIWDRRSALSPAIKKNKELEERDDKIEKALKEYAHKEPRLAEILRNVGIM